jgi:hypothetical protein
LQSISGTDEGIDLKTCTVIDYFTHGSRLARVKTVRIVAGGTSEARMSATIISRLDNRSKCLFLYFKKPQDYFQLINPSKR